MADIIQFRQGSAETGHPLLAIPGLAERCRAIVAPLPQDMRAAALGSHPPKAAVGALCAP
jgi:hypothetical protein